MDAITERPWEVPMATGPAPRCLGAAARALRALGRRPGDLLGPLAVLRRGVVDVPATGVDLARPGDLQVRVLVLLHPLGDPARGPRDREDHREHIGRDP